MRMMATPRSPSRKPSRLAIDGRWSAEDMAPILPDRPRAVKRAAPVCCCSIKMSAPNCSVKVSSHEPTGDTHDEPEGSPASGVAQSLGGGTGDGGRGGGGLAPERSTGPPTAPPLRDGGGRGTVAPQPRPAVAAAAGAAAAPAGGHAAHHDVPG